MTVIARITTDFPTKFGLPRQSGLVDELVGRIVFEPEYRNVDALRGMEGYSHLWLLWQFDRANRPKGGWSALVHPPRLGGNTQMGVFATRSPFRPNPIGLSSVRLTGIDLEADDGPVLYVSGADLADNTPIFDIKPYLAYTDSHPDATGGFADLVRDYALEVVFPPALLQKLPADKREAIVQVLAQDPRPAYQNDPTRLYGVEFAGFDVRFTVRDGVLTVSQVVKLKPGIAAKDQHE